MFAVEAERDFVGGAARAPPLLNPTAYRLLLPHEAKPRAAAAVLRQREDPVGDPQRDPLGDEAHFHPQVDQLGMKALKA